MTFIPGNALDAGMFPSGPRKSAWDWIWDHNPCFLLSTVMMLVGCYLLNSEMDVKAGDVGKLFSLLDAINCYEAAIILLGLVLIRRTRGVARDGMWLLLFETLLLLDGTFLIAETVEASVTWGWVINLALLMLAIGKGAVVIWGTGIRLAARTIGFLTLQLFIIYGLPVVLNNLADNGVVSGSVMYAAWWAVGLLPVIYDLVARLEGDLPAMGTAQQVVRRVYVIVPWLLLIAHLGFFHYTYHADFVLADLAPVCVGLAVATLRMRPMDETWSEAIRAARMILPGAAVLVTVMGSGDLHWVAEAIDVTIRPGLLTVCAVVMAYSYFASLRAAAFAALGMTLMAIGWVVREGIFTLVRRAMELLQKTASGAAGMMPSSAQSWGVAAMVMAFVLLGIGAWVSLRRRTSASGTT